jgi:nicotinamidase-related amidase
MAAPTLAELAHPARTALITSEIQNGVVGPGSGLPQLADAAKAIIEPTARLCASARSVGVRVIHGTATRRADGAGSNANARLFQAVRRSEMPLLPGSWESQVVDELGPDERDLVLTRLHGLNPMAGTDLDPILRNLGVSTLVVTGVSVNVAVTNLVMDAVNLGYQVVLPRDAVCGIPQEYADALIDGTLALLATVTTVDALVDTWSALTPEEPA